jgi:small-conductance mechanosensitive channel
MGLSSSSALQLRSLTRYICTSPEKNGLCAPRAVSAFFLNGSSSFICIPTLSLRSYHASVAISEHRVLIAAVAKPFHGSTIGLKPKEAQGVPCRMSVAEARDDALGGFKQRIYHQQLALRSGWSTLPLGHRSFAASARDVASGSPGQGGTGPVSPPAASSSPDVSATTAETGTSANISESVQKGLNSMGDMLVGAWEAARESAREMVPVLQKWMDPSGTESIAQLVAPASAAVGVSLAAWFVLPRVLRTLHSYVESGPTAHLLRRTPEEKSEYKDSVFGALEMPARLLATVVTFSYLGYIVAPTSIGAQYLTRIWSGATVISIIWFLYRWKSNVFAHIVAGKTTAGGERERYLLMDRISSIGLLVLGAMAFAEACGVAVQSVLTLGGIGGVATAFAARDILGNMLSGVFIQFTRPFTVGDSINAGSVSGQVVEMGFHSTQLLNSDKFPIVVPNSYFSNQVIINKSRARWRGLSLNLPVRLTDFDKIPSITANIRSMLNSHPRVFLGKEKPRCYVSQVGPSSLIIAISCNLKPMGTDDYLVAQEELLLQAAKIVNNSGAVLGADFAS